MDKAFAIKKILCDCLDDDFLPSSITTNTSLVKELNMHSIVYVEFVISLEDYFDTEIPDEYLNFNSYETYGELEAALLTIFDKKDDVK